MLYFLNILLGGGRSCHPWQDVALGSCLQYIAHIRNRHCQQLSVISTLQQIFAWVHTSNISHSTVLTGNKAQQVDISVWYQINLKTQVSKHGTTCMLLVLSSTRVASQCIDHTSAFISLGFLHECYMPPTLLCHKCLDAKPSFETGAKRGWKSNLLIKSSVLSEWLNVAVCCWRKSIY